MQVTLEVTTGALAGNKIRVKPGQLAQVGRTTRADFPFVDDSHMSGVHFVLECDEKACRIRDWDSRNGTLVNGQRVDAVVLQDGDQIVAGQTRFTVRVESDEVGVPPVPAETAPVAATPQDKLLAMLRSDFQPLYAILDAAREPSVLKVLLESKAECQSLFEGAEGAQLAHFAPYVVSLPADSPLLETLVRQGWGKSWGIYLTCDRPFEELRAHFRQFLMVKLPDDKQVYFRYYDPRVLRLFLPTCTAEEINLFFGPVKSYLMEDEALELLVRFSNAGRGVARKFLPLSSGQPPGSEPTPAIRPGKESHPAQ